MTDIIICGIGGKMGANILKALEDYDDVRCVGGIDAYADPSKFSVPVFKKPSDIDIEADVIVDFSRPEALQGLLDFATSRKVALLLATTGYSPEQLEAVKEASKRTAIFRSANMSLGINLLIGLARRAAAFLGDKFDVEIVETHHNKKVDSPSGTALRQRDRHPRRPRRHSRRQTRGQLLRRRRGDHPHPRGAQQGGLRPRRDQGRGVPQRQGAGHV